MLPGLLLSEKGDALVLRHDGEQQPMMIEEDEMLAYYAYDDDGEGDDDDDDGPKKSQQNHYQNTNGGVAGDDDSIEEEDTDSGSFVNDDDSLGYAFEDYWYNDPKEITAPSSLVGSQRLRGTLQIALGSESDWDGLVKKVLLYYGGPCRGGLHVELYCHPEDFGCPNWTCVEAKQFILTLASIRPREFNLRYTSGFPISLLKGFLQQCRSTLEHLTVDPGVVFIDDDAETPVLLTGIDDSISTRATQGEEASDLPLRNPPLASGVEEGQISLATNVIPTFNDDGGDDDQQQQTTKASVQPPPVNTSMSISVVRRGIEKYDDEIRDFDYISGMTAFLCLPMFSDGSACQIEIHDVYYDHFEEDDDEIMAGKELLACIGRLRAEAILLTNVLCGDSTTKEKDDTHYISAMCKLVGRTEIFDLDCRGDKVVRQSFHDHLLVAMANAVKDNTTLQELNIWYRSEESSLPSILSAFERCMESNYVLKSLDLYNAGARSKVTLSEKTRLLLFLNKGEKRRFKALTTSIDASSSGSAVAVVPTTGGASAPRTYHGTQEWIKAIIHCNNDEFLETHYYNHNNNQEKENDLLKLSGIMYFLRDKPELLLGARSSIKTTTAATRIENKPDVTAASLEETTGTVTRSQQGTIKRKSSDNASYDLIHHGTEENGREAKILRLWNKNTKTE